MRSGVLLYLGMMDTWGQTYSEMEGDQVTLGQGSVRPPGTLWIKITTTTGYRLNNCPVFTMYSQCSRWAQLTLAPSVTWSPSISWICLTPCIPSYPDIGVPHSSSTTILTFSYLIVSLNHLHSTVLTCTSPPFLYLQHTQQTCVYKMANDPTHAYSLSTYKSMD